MEKACSIMVSKVKSQSMAGRGDFSKMWFFFLKVYWHFFMLVFMLAGKCSFFWMSFFLVLQGYVSKNSKKNFRDILRLWIQSTSPQTLDSIHLIKRHCIIEENEKLAHVWGSHPRFCKSFGIKINLYSLLANYWPI